MCMYSRLDNNGESRFPAMARAKREELENVGGRHRREKGEIVLVICQ